MSNNTQLNTNTTSGDIIATEDISGVKIQRNKLAVGVSGVDDGDVSSSNPMPVNISQLNTYDPKFMLMESARQAYAVGIRANLVDTVSMYNSSFTADGSNTTYTITHSLNNRQSLIQVMDSSYNLVITDISNPSVNTTTVSFTVAPTNGTVFYITVIG